MAKLKEQVKIQIFNQEFDLSDIESRVRENWKEQGNKVNTIDTLTIYIKPEDGKVYYVVNDEISCSIDL